MAITTTFDGFTVDYKEAARQALESTAKEMEKYDTAQDATGRVSNAGYQSQSGELVSSFEYDIEETLFGPTLIYRNTAPHAIYVEHIEGISVMPSVTSGRAARILKREMEKAMDHAE